MQSGGDGYGAFRKAKVLVDALNGTLLASVVMDYIAAKKEISPKAEGRIVLK